MQRSVFKRSGRVVITLVRWLLVVCLVAVTISALSNLGLPARSQVVDRLSDVEKARLAEMFHLRQTLGDTVWPGWSQAEIPVIVYNEAYAFLIGYPDPPPGWRKMPQRIARGGAWEPVPDDTFAGQPYFRQHLADPNVTPESFTVLVGERWVATFATKEYAQIDFVHGLRAELPPVVRTVFPYRLAWRWLLGESEAYIGALEHEAFHAYQGQVAPARLARAEAAMQHDPLYHWDDRALRAAWQQEVNLLADAAQAPSDVEATALARRFLAQRDARRAHAKLSPALVDYERQREWLEGLAKYIELAIGRAAATTPGYQPAPAIANDLEFRHYTTRERFWSMQLDGVRRLSGRTGETRFYYTGAAQAALLDRLMPGWKAQILTTDMTLEDMLRAAATGHTVQGQRR
ncbi:MAG TPA: hypothetical protein VFU22_06700 [Roseiflexaceae bacterium]|nr:hypothetical protein [Roseiflexaceae bacterium]